MGTIGMEEDKIFTILSHPLRRKILRHAFKEGKISYTLLASEWNVSTGSIYHHLKKLENLVRQEDDQSYVLTDAGRALCKKYLAPTQNQPSISNTKVHPLVTIMDQSRELAILHIITIIIFSYFAAEVGITVFGTLFIPSTDSSFIGNVVIAIVFGAVYFLLTFIITDKSPVLLFSIYSLAYLIFLILTLLASTIPLLFGIKLTTTVWIILSSTLQVIFLLTLYLIEDRMFGSKFVRVMTVTLGYIYLNMLAAFIIVG